MHFSPHSKTHYLSILPLTLSTVIIPPSPQNLPQGPPSSEKHSITGSYFTVIISVNTPWASTVSCNLLLYA